MRAIPAQRLLASHVLNLGVGFSYANPSLNGMVIDPIVVFSPAMFLPAVIAKAEALATFAFGSADVLGVRRSHSEMGVLGVEADVMPIDGSPQGILRSLLLTRATEQIFELNVQKTRDQLVDLSVVAVYYRTAGAPAVRGEQSDVLSVESTNYEWRA